MGLNFINKPFDMPHSILKGKLSYCKSFKQTCHMVLLKGTL